MKLRVLGAAMLALAWILGGNACARPGGGTPSPPPSLYYLDGLDAAAQVWTLDLESLRAAQVTNQEGGVYNYAVSPADGTLAYISQNRLYLWEAGEDTPRLLVGLDTAAPPPDYDYPAWMEGLAFSPDGRTLAYDLYGVRLYHLDSGADELLLASPGNLLGEAYVFEREYYSPESWSPDGRQLLITMGYYEGSTLAVWEPGADPPFRRLRTNGPACCQFTWAGDSGSVLVTNPYFTVNPPGMWAFSADTGLEASRLEGFLEDGNLLFPGWPFQSLAGELSYFRLVISPPALGEAVFQNEGITFQMARQDRVEGESSLLRPEEFRISEALWSPDASFALIVQPAEEGRRLVLAPADGSPLQELLQGQYLRSLSWGP